VRWFRRWAERRAGAPRTAGAAVRQALLAALDRDGARAAELLALAVRLDSEDVLAYLALGRAWRQQGEIGRAIRVHQNLLLRQDLAPAERRAALAELAADFRQGGFLRRAIACYEEVLAEDARHRDALGALARLYRDARRFDDAIDAERRLARLEGREAGAVEAELQVEIAAAARGEGRTSDALRALKRALRRDPRCASAWIALGDLEVERGRNKAALEAWRQVPQLDRRAAREVYPRLASAFAAAGRGAEYEAFLRARIDEEPDDVGPRLALARALAARGATDDAMAEIRRLLEREPESLEAHATLGRILLAEDRDPEALKEYAEFLEALDRAGLLRTREWSR
jgi:lipopolysaccharide biosynthesis regulator YciM